MGLREKMEQLPSQVFVSEDVCIRKIKDDHDLWYATVECTLKPGQDEFVNPAGFSIGRAWLHPEDNVPCVICRNNGERIGYIIFRVWSYGLEGSGYSWSYYLDQNWQGMGYGEKAARLAVRILQAADGAMPIKLATEQDNRRAQALYERIGFYRLDELDGDDLVFELPGLMDES